jgi:hypothetical protein
MRLDGVYALFGEWHPRTANPIDSTMDDEENKQFAAFERSQEFFNALEFILSCDLTVDPTDEEEDKEKLVFQKLCLIVRDFTFILDTLRNVLISSDPGIIA